MSSLNPSLCNTCPPEKDPVVSSRDEAETLRKIQGCSSCNKKPHKKDRDEIESRSYGIETQRNSNYFLVNQGVTATDA